MHQHRQKDFKTGCHNPKKDPQRGSQTTTAFRYGEDSVHFKSFTLKWTEWLEIIPSIFKVDRMVLKTIPSTSKVLLSVQQAGRFSAL